MQKLLKSGALQAKLTINQPGDLFEQEADRVADAVMRMPDPAVNPKAITRTASTASLQRCSCGKSASVSGECEECKGKSMQLHRTASSSSASTTAPPIVHDVLSSPGQPLDAATRSFMEPRFGRNFSHVRVHTDAHAAESAQAVNALAYTVGHDIVFARSQYAPQTCAGQRLLAHELAHTIQQRAVERHPSNSMAAAENVRLGPSVKSDGSVPQGLQRTVRLNVLDWDANKLGAPAPRNSDDGNSIEVPEEPNQMQATAEVKVDGDAGDNCAEWQLGTTQTAWIAWTIHYYAGRNPGDGSVTIRLRHTVPVRDPNPDGNVWFNQKDVRSPGSCGDSVDVFHRDAPSEWIAKTVVNDTAGGATNYLRGYTRGLHLVTYLTARDPEGNFLRTPLRFVYWNSIHDFRFKPNFAALQDMWAFTGQVQVNIGAKGRGAVSDAPYFTTTGPTYNDQLDDPANVIRTETR